MANGNYWYQNTWIMVSWDPPFDDGMAITKYELEVSNEDPANYGSFNAWSTLTDHPCSDSLCSTELVSSSFNMPVSRPLQNRTFRVRAFNGLWSNWSAYISHISGDPRPPLQMHPPIESYELRPHNANNCTSITVSGRRRTLWGRRC